MIASVGPDDAELLVARLTEVLDGARTPCSIGIAPFSVADGFAGACGRADAAMYDNKRARRASRGSPPAVRGVETSPSPYAP